MTQAAAPLRRNRDFALLWSGQVVSTVGSEVSQLAFPLLVLALTGSARDAGIVGFARGLPFLLVYLPAGVLVDRWNRKRVMLAADAGRALAIGSVAVWLALGRPPLAWLAVASFVEGCLFVFFQLSESAALPAERAEGAAAAGDRAEPGARAGRHASSGARSAARSTGSRGCSRSRPTRSRTRSRSSRSSSSGRPSRANGGARGATCATRSRRGSSGSGGSASCER